MKIRPVGAELFHAGGRTDRHDRANSPFSHIIYIKPTRCTSGSIVFMTSYRYALHVSDALCVHHQEHYKL